MNHRRATTVSKGLDVFGAVEELHNLSAKEMNKLLRDSQHLFTLRVKTGRGSCIRVNLERLVSHLPLHLIACLASRGPEPRLRYLLRGVRLLHSLSDLALRHPKLEQIFLHEVKIREQVLDLIIYMLITLASPEQEGRLGSSFTILHAALVACSLHLLPAFVAGEWSDLVPVLLMHPKVDIFMDVAFDAVRRDIVLFQTKLRGLNSKLMSNRVSATVAASMAEVIAQQCEASVQVLQSLCQPQAFRDKVLNHKELCKNGGLLRLTLAVLRLQVPVLLAESKYLVSLVNRLKSKILLLMVKFCDTESVSFLDEVAADVSTMQLAETVAIEVLGLVRNALYKVPLREFREADDDDDDDVPSGLLYIHAMRLADIFSDDSNFRNLVMDYIAPDFAKVLAQSPTVFLSRWCGSSGKDEIKSGSDSVLIYDPFKAAGAAMHSFKNSGGSATRTSGSNNALLPDESSGCSLSAGQLQFSSYSQERSALFVKILANLHCFNPEICPVDEKDRFLNLFVECLMVGPFTPGNSAFFLSTVQTAVRVCENLFMLLDHVSNMSSEAVSDEDLQLVSTFYSSLHDVICPSTSSEDSMQEDPVVAYVKDAHEQKRKNLLAQLQKSERWKKISLFEPGDGEDQNNGGSPMNKSSTHSPAIQPAPDESENINILSEETHIFGDKSVQKRKRGEIEEDLKARKKEHNMKPWEIEENPSNDSGFQLLTQMNEVKKDNDGNVVAVSDVKMTGNSLGVINNEPVKDANVLQDVHWNDSMQAFKNENIAGLGWKHNNLNMYMKSDAVNIQTNKEEIVRANMIDNGLQTNKKESQIDIERVPNKCTEDLGENKLKMESKAMECPADEFKLQNQSIGLEIDHRGSRGMFSAHKISKELATRDTYECSDTAVLSEATTTKEMQMDLRNQVSMNSENREISKEGTTPFHMGRFRQTNNTECVINMNADSELEVDSPKFSTGFEMSKGDVGLPLKDSDVTVVSYKKEAPNLVAMKCDIYSSGNLSRSHGINTADGLSSKKEVKQPIEIGVVKIDISERPDDIEPVKVKTTGSDCNDKAFAVEFQPEEHSESFSAVGGSNKSQDEERFSIQRDINLKLKSNVDGFANQDGAAGTQNQGCQPLICSVNKEEHKFDFGRLGDLQVAQHPEYCHNMAQSSLDTSNFSMPESFKIHTAETFQVSAPTASHVYSSEETGVYLSDGCRASGSDGSRVYPTLEANNRMLLGQNDDMQPRKRKRNIMSEEQMALMENALRGEPYMRRHPDLIMQWTHKLNQIGPEISYQQLKNWLNNRKARLLRQRAGDVPDGRLYGHEASAPGSSTCSGSSNDPNRSASEDGGNTRDSGSTLQTKHISNVGIAQCKLATEDMDAILDIDMNAVNRSSSTVDMNLNRGFAEPDKFGKHIYDTAEVDMTSSRSRRSAPIPATVKFVRCEAGQFVSLLDKEGNEAATGTLCQVEGVWQGKRIDEHGICIVKIVQLNVDKTTRLPHPSPLTGSTFEEAENLCGQMIVAWDTKRIFLIS